mmetsp:Transcript_5514/g.9923  ORF Transcript_5514/g.9923 Transcript_5514/m.9923 type:complete len:205 (+) Transcript_5514:49-663(+)
MAPGLRLPKVLASRQGDTKPILLSRRLSAGIPVYDPSCLRPGPDGVFPTCEPDNGPPCCLGLTCEPVAGERDEYRCGNNVENGAMGGGNASPVETGAGYDYSGIWKGYPGTSFLADDGVQVSSFSAKANAMQQLPVFAPAFPESQGRHSTGGALSQGLVSLAWSFLLVALCWSLWRWAVGAKSGYHRLGSKSAAQTHGSSPNTL